MVYEEVRRDHFNSVATEEKISLSSNTTISDQTAHITISDKSEKELYWEKFKTLMEK